MRSTIELESELDDDLSSMDDSISVENIEPDDSIDDLKYKVIERAVIAFEMRRIHQTKLDAHREGVRIKDAELYKAGDDVETSWQTYVTGYVIFMTQLFPHDIETPKAIQEAESILTNYTAIQDVVGFERQVSAELDKKISIATIEASLEESCSSSSSFSSPLVKKTLGFFTIADPQHTHSFDSLASDLTIFSQCTG